jgi:phosphohistidine phosphatase
MALYLVQHGISLAKDIDPDQGLSEQGITEVERVAERAHHFKLHVSEIIHSGKKRAHQTADIFAGWLTHGREPTVSSGLASLDDVIPAARVFADSADLMIVGHLPFLEHLASYLILKSPEIPVVKFTNGGIVCLDRVEREPGRKTWLIRWILTPEIA